MEKLSELVLSPGRLLVIPENKSREDGDFIVQESGQQVSIAVVAKCNTSVDVRPGDKVVYDRLHATEIELISPEGTKQMYRFLLERDLAAIILVDRVSSDMERTDMLKRFYAL